MSDTATAAPAAPSTPAAPAAPAEAGKTHHSANQVRDPVGKFAGGVQTPPAGDSTQTQPVAPTEQQKQTARDRLLAIVDEEGYVTRKVDGQPVRISLERALAELDMSEAAKRRFSKLDQERKEFEARRAKFREDPWSVMQEEGLDPDEAAYNRLKRLAEEADLSPQERARRELDAEREKIRLEREKWQQEQEQAAVKAEQDRLVPMLAKHGPEAMQAAGLPMVPQAVESFQGYLREAVAAGQALSPELLKHAAEAARDDLRSSSKAFLSGLDGAALVSELGPEVLGKLRAHMAAEFKAKQAQRGIQPAPKQEPTVVEPAQPKPLTPREWREAQAKRGL